MRVLVWVIRLYDLLGLAVPAPVAHCAFDAVLVKQPDVEPNRRVERHLLGGEHVGEFGPKGGGLCAVDEIAIAFAPCRDRVDDTIDHLLQGGFAFGRVDRTPEILLGEDVGGILGPRSRHLHAGLFEGDRTVSMVDETSVAVLPLDVVVWVSAFACETAAKAEGGRLGGECHGDSGLSKRVRVEDYVIVISPMSSTWAMVAMEDRPTWVREQHRDAACPQPLSAKGPRGAVSTRLSRRFCHHHPGGPSTTAGSTLRPTPCGPKGDRVWIRGGFLPSHPQSFPRAPNMGTTGPPSTASVVMVQQLYPTPISTADPLALYPADSRPMPDDRPWVMANMVASADGAISIDGVSGGLGGEGDRIVFRAIRASCDWIVVAAGTASAERYGIPRPDAEVVERRLATERSPAARLAVVTASVSLDPELPMFADQRPDDEPPLIITGSNPPADRVAAIGDRAVWAHLGAPRPTPEMVLAELHRRGARVVLAEGGPSFNGQLVAESLHSHHRIRMATGSVHHQYRSQQHYTRAWHHGTGTDRDTALSRHHG